MSQVLFPGTHDPADIADYLVEFSDALASGETVSLSAITIDATSATAGMALGSGSYAAVATGTRVRFWLTCSNASNAAFAAGLQATVTVRVSTNASPARQFERAVSVVVRQSDRPDLSPLAPVSLAEAKQHLRLVDGDSTDDDYVAALVNAAADAIERDTGLVMRARDVAAVYDGWVHNGSNRVPIWRAPCNSVVSVAYDDQNGAAQTLAANQYRLREFAGCPYVVPAYNVTWPTTEAVHGAVRLTVNAGYANNDTVPATLKHAALLLVGHWYENREAVNSDRTPVETPLAYEALIRPHRLRLVA